MGRPTVRLRIYPTIEPSATSIPIPQPHKDFFSVNADGCNDRGDESADEHDPQVGRILILILSRGKMDKACHEDQCDPDP